MNDWSDPPLTPRQRDVQSAYSAGLWRGIRYGFLVALPIWAVVIAVTWWACQ